MTPSSLSPCQSRSASAKRRQAMRASTSSQEPGKRTTPNFMPRPPPSAGGRALPAPERSLFAPLRSPRSADWPAGARTSAAPVRRPPRPARSADPHARWPLPRNRVRAGRVPPPAPAGRGFPTLAVSTREPSRRSPQPRLEGLARDALVCVHVERAGALYHVVGKRGRGRRLVPAGPGGPVAHVLLVEAGLTAPGLIPVGRPEARGVGGHHLVAQHDRAVAA